MAHPKHKISKTRRDKRRTHYKAVAANVSIDKVTGTPHLFHRAYEVDGNLFYKGKLVVEAKATA